MEFDKITRSGSALIKPSTEEGLFVLSRLRFKRTEYMVSRTINFNLSEDHTRLLKAGVLSVIDNYVHQDDEGIISFSNTHPFLINTYAGSIALLGQPVQELAAFRTEGQK
jgi:hypothetical protein